MSKVHETNSRRKCEVSNVDLTRNKQDNLVQKSTEMEEAYESGASKIFNVTNGTNAQNSDSASLNADTAETESVKSTNSEHSESKHKALVRQNRLVSQRIRRAQSDHGELSETTSTSEYMTPFQRKDQMIRDLKIQLRQLKQINEENDKEMVQFEKNKSEEMQTILKEKDYEIAGLVEMVNDLKENHKQLTDAYQKTLDTIEALEARNKEMKEKYNEKDKKQQEMFLQMYQKGQEAALIERQNQLDEIGTLDPNEIETKELLKRLENTSNELAKWQTMKCCELYKSAPDFTNSEADAILHCVKDALFHYLTDPKDKEEYLRLIITVMKYTDVQLNNIEKGLGKKTAQKLKLINNGNESIEDHGLGKAQQNKQRSQSEPAPLADKSAERSTK